MRVLQFFAGVFFQLLRDMIVFRAFQGLAVNDVGNDGLVFARKIFVENSIIRLRLILFRPS